MAGNDEYVIFLLKSDIYSGGEQTFVDSSEYGHIISRYGNVSHSTVGPHFHTTSIACTHQYNARLQVLNNTTFDMGSGDFTIDAWVKDSNRSVSNTIVSKGWKLYTGTSGQIWFEAAGLPSIICPAGTLPYNVWTHVALVRYGSDWRIYVNGVSIAFVTSSIALNFYSGNGFVVGCNSSGPNAAIGMYYDEVRISKGIARWTSDFTPPTSPYTVGGITAVGEGGAVAGGEANIYIPSLIMQAEGGAVVGGSPVIKIPQYSIVASSGAVVGGEAPYITDPNLKGPIHHWPMNELVGLVTPNERDGQPSLTMSADSGRSLTTGKFSQAISSDTFLPSQALAASEDIPFMSVSMWIKRHNSSNAVYFLANVDSDFSVVQFFHNHSTYFLGITNQSGQQYSDLSFNDLNWHHICIVKNEAETELWMYLDGVKSTVAINDLMPTLRYFSKNGTSLTSMNPIIDNVQVYDRILSDAEVLWLYNAVSDFTYAPRLPFLLHLNVEGGALVGGTAPYTKTVSLNHVGSGGAVVGGAAESITNFLDVGGVYPSYVGDVITITDGIATISGHYPKYIGTIIMGNTVEGRYPKYIGSAVLQHTINTSISARYPKYKATTGLAVTRRVSVHGHYPKYVGNLDTGWKVEGRYPSYIGTAFTTHIDLASVVGTYPRYVGSAGVTVTRLMSAAGKYPKYRGNAVVEVHLVLRSIGTYPVYRGSASLETTRFVSVFGSYPAYRGSSILDAGTETDQLLSFSSHVYSRTTAADIPVSSTSEDLLQFNRGDGT